MGCEDISLALSIPVASVRQRIRQVRENMRSKLFSERDAVGLTKLQAVEKGSE